jgi:hypothetical protein
MTDPERLFVQIWNRLTADWGRLTTFRQMGVLGEDAARESIHRNNTHFVQQQLVHGQLQHLLKDREGFIADGMDLSMPNAMTEAAVLNFRTTLHAATLVFAHSILDAAVFDCVKICAAEAPTDWAGQLGGRKVALSDAASRTYSELLREAVEVELGRLERESILAKVDRLFQLCRPTKQEFLTNGFRFDRERLTKLDALRHQVVHAPGAPIAFDSIYEDLQFMQSSGLHLFCMVGDRFSLKFSGTEAFQALSARQASPG